MAYSGQGKVTEPAALGRWLKRRLTMALWRQVVRDPLKIKVFEALENPKYEWRTMNALKRESGLQEKEILKILEEYKDLVRNAQTRDGEPIWTLQERYWKRPGLVQFMDFISSTSTSSG